MSWSHSAYMHTHTYPEISRHQFSPCSTVSISVPTDIEIQGILREHHSAVLRSDDTTQ